MTRTLALLNMPTRSDVSSLAERLTNIELRLDDLDARLDEIRSAATQQSTLSNHHSAASADAEEVH